LIPRSLGNFNTFSIFFRANQMRLFLFGDCPDKLLSRVYGWFDRMVIVVIEPSQGITFSYFYSLAKIKISHTESTPTSQMVPLLFALAMLILRSQYLGNRFLK
jgi:hypothetical protein